MWLRLAKKEAEQAAKAGVEMILLIRICQLEAEMASPKKVRPGLLLRIALDPLADP